MVNVDRSRRAVDLRRVNKELTVKSNDLSKDSKLCVL